MIELGEGGAKRGHEDDGVENRPGEQAVCTVRHANRLTHSLAGRKFFAVCLAEFDSGDESALADFVDNRVGGFEAGEASAQVSIFSDSDSSVFS